MKSRRLDRSRLTAHGTDSGIKENRETLRIGRRNLLHRAGLGAASISLLPLFRCTTSAPTRPSIISAPVGGNDEPYPIPWLDKNGSHNQAGPGLEPSSIYHFNGRVARAAGFLGSGVDGAGNRLAFGAKTTDNAFMQGECWTSQRRARRGAWTHL